MQMEIRKLVKDRANHICEYCLALSQYAFHPFCVDHIIPISKQGSHLPDNLAFACQHCNNCKYNKYEHPDPLTGKIIPLYNPRKSKWSDHFVWDEDDSVIVGITSIGRATVSCLKMNREEAVNLRAALKQYGVHPPKL
jgi:5-methylcytosine-specific restriction endonuclease McrA